MKRVADRKGRLQVIKFVCPYLTKRLKAKALHGLHGYLCQALPCHICCHWTTVMEMIMPSSRRTKIDTPFVKLETR